MTEPTQPTKAAEKRLNKKTLGTKARDQCARALQVLVQLMDGEAQASVKLAAAREILDRGFGRPESGRTSRAKAHQAVRDSGLTVIIKRANEITPEEEAAAEATERGEL